MKKFQQFYEKYMYVVGIAGSFPYFLQAMKIFSEKSAAAVSLWAFLVGLLAVLSWMVYGILIKNRVVLIANILGSIGALVTVIGIIIYK